MWHGYLESLRGLLWPYGSLWLCKGLFSKSILRHCVVEEIIEKLVSKSCSCFSKKKCLFLFPFGHVFFKLRIYHCPQLPLAFFLEILSTQINLSKSSSNGSTSIYKKSFGGKVSALFLLLDDHFGINCSCFLNAASWCAWKKNSCSSEGGQAGYIKQVFYRHFSCHCNPPALHSG